MLQLQVLVFLSLGMLCSSAPRWSPGEEQRSRALVALIIQEILQDIQKLNFSAVPSIGTVDARVERCMQSHLKTFAASLAALDKPSKIISTKLSRVNTYKNILPKDLDKECKTVQVTSEVFLETLDNFLRLLSEKIQKA